MIPTSRLAVAYETRARLVVVTQRAPAAPAMQIIDGLESALEPALRTYDSLWLGWNGDEHDHPPSLRIHESRASFHLSTSARAHFDDGFCHRALRPLLHGFAGRVRYHDDDWRAYVEVNDLFGRFAAELVDHDGTLWVHDYPLLLVGKAAKRHGFAGSTGLFMHAPFPPPDTLETLPWCDDLLAAMSSYDLLGFHTEQWAHNFRACVHASSARTGDKIAMPSIGVLPIGIDPLSVASATGVLDREVIALRAALGGRRLILGVDRLEYANGIPERLEAFDRLLARFPEWRGQVTFIQISMPSRTSAPEHVELRQKVEKLVGGINGRYGEADWVPVRYLYRAYEHRVLAQLYRTADVALVTPLRDGMNLVAKEFVAAQDRSDPGVLILSRFAGAAAQLTDALLTNPYHPDGLASDIHRALRMDLDERRQRQTALAAVVDSTETARWAEVFLQKLSDQRRPRV